MDSLQDEMSTINVSDRGRYYKDYYKVIVDWENRSDWSPVTVKLKKEFLSFRREILERHQNGCTILCGENSLSYEGNVLEAINLALNPFGKHYIDRDLLRTGLSIVIVTPGTGVFEVNKELLRLTAERMIDNGICLDLVCLSKPPLHTVPLFGCHIPKPSTPSDTEIAQATATAHSFAINDTSEKASTSSAFHIDPSTDSATLTKFVGKLPVNKLSCKEQQPEFWDPLYCDDLSKVAENMEENYLYSFPHWIDCSFYRHDNELPVSRRVFVTRAKMYELQMMGIVENETAFSICIPHFDDTALGSIQTEKGFRDANLGINGSHPELNNDNSRALGQTNIAEFDMISTLKDANAGSDAADDGLKQWKQKREEFEKDSEKENRPRVENDDNVAPSLAIMDMYDENIFTVKDRATLRLRHARPSPLRDIVSEHSLELTTQLLGNTTLSLENNGNMDLDHRYGTSQDLLRSAPLGTGTLLGKDENSTVFVGSKLTVTNTGDRQSSVMRCSYTRRSVGDTSTHDRTSSHAAPSYVRRSLVRTQSDNVDVIRSSSNSSFVKNGMAHGSSTSMADEEISEMTTNSSTVQPISIKSKTHIPRTQAKDFTSPMNSYTDSIRGSFSSDMTTSRPYNRHSPGRSPAAAMNRPFVQRVNFINPCNPSKSMFRLSSDLRRWHHIFPKASLQAVGHGTKWTSLCTPACLPLTTDYFPTSEELANSYEEYTYTVSPSEDLNEYPDSDCSEQGKTESLLQELISQRLAQGFQLIVSRLLDSSVIVPGKKGKIAAVAPTVKTSNVRISDTCEKPLSGKQRTTRPTSKPYYLSMGQHVHKLTYDSSGQNVEIKRFVRKLDYRTDPIKYSCVIWPKHFDFYQPRIENFSYPHLSNYNWNYLDHFVSGYQDEMTESLRYWRTRFILVPSDNLVAVQQSLNPNGELNEEEVRLAGFVRFLEVIQKACWNCKSSEHVGAGGAGINSKNSAPLKNLRIIYTTFDLPAYVTNEVLLSSDNNSVNSGSRRSSMTRLGLTKDSKLSTIAQAMKNPSHGLKLKDQRWNLRTYENAFIGGEFVDWMICAFADIETREEATDYGNVLLSKGLIVHGRRNHRFLDGIYFYQLSPEFAPPRSPGSGYKPRFWHSRLSGQADASGGKGTEDASVPLMDFSSEKRTPVRVELSKSMVIDVDPSRKSDRREKAVVHYDVIHNPKNCYHFQLNWLACTARLIEDMLQSWSRAADKGGLKLIEAPVEQAKTSADDNPFQSTVYIPLALSPPPIPFADLSSSSSSLSSSGIAESRQSGTPMSSSLHSPDKPQQLYYEMELVKHHGFILDVNSDDCFPEDVVKRVYSYDRTPFKYTQFIHRSGVAFVQLIGPGKGFLWANNRLLTSHANVYSSKTFSTTGTTTSGANANFISNNNPDDLREKFRQFCGDPIELSRFWTEITVNGPPSSSSLPPSTSCSPSGSCASLPILPTLSDREAGIPLPSETIENIGTRLNEAFEMGINVKEDTSLAVQKRS